MTDLTQAQQDAAAEAAATLKAAQDDLVALQTFQVLVNDPTTTVPQLVAAGTALPAQIGDPSRAQAVQSLAEAWPNFLGSLATLVSQTNALANPPATQ